ncbi:MAG TPA: hypothetical protein VHT91_26250 [Kofleriaceae bacterium]|jgi:uncharacterized low-complexity protein|nr:hypothetical protein [Kofleriaceae bacterium]
MTNTLSANIISDLDSVLGGAGKASAAEGSSGAGKSAAGEGSGASKGSAGEGSGGKRRDGSGNGGGGISVIITWHH